MDPLAVARVKAQLDAGKRFIVFLHPNIGDVVNLTAVLGWLRDSLKPEFLAAVTSPLVAPLARCCPAVDEVWERPETFPARLEFVRRLKSSRFDVSIHCQGQNTMLRMAARAGIPLRIGVYGSKHRNLLHLGVEWQPGEVEQPGTMGRLLGTLGLDVSDHKPQLEIPSAARAKAASLLGDGKSVAVMVGASHPAKKWPLERFLAVAQHINDQVVFIGGPAEAKPLSGTDLGDALNLAGQLSILETAAVLERCRLLVTNDSGPMHLAAAMGTRVVAVFGPTSADRFHPYGPGHSVIEGGCDCRAKDLDTCSGACLRSVTTDSVVSQL